MFIKSEKGSLGIPAAIGGLVMVGAVGAAFDVSRLVTERHTLQSMADAAALAATMPDDISTQERQALAKATIDDYLRQTGETLAVNLDSFDVAGDGERVSLTLASRKDLVFGGIVGMSDHTVKASSTAAEVTGADANAGAAILTSISFVVGYTDTMSGRSMSSVSLMGVKSAVASALMGVDEDSLETSFYPYNWGTDQTNTVPLQPGVTSTLQALLNANSSEGSVPSDAMEQATADQTDNSKPVEKYVVFITDSSVDNEKSDVRNQYLSDGAVVDGGNLTCRTIPDELIAEQDELVDRIEEVLENETMPLSSWTWGGEFDDDLVEHDDGDSIADGFRKREMLDKLSAEMLIRYGDANADRVHDPEAWQWMDTDWDVSQFGFLTWIQGQRRRFLLEKMKYEETCSPVQERRVLDACETARSDDVRIVGIDISGEDAAGTQLVQECVFGELIPKVSDAEIDSDTGSDEFPFADAQLVEGLSPFDPDKYVGPDGSIYVSVSSTSELRSVLQSIMPKQNANNITERRSVRLIR
jgi:Flp pilus assembly protein TadG